MNKLPTIALIFWLIFISACGSKMAATPPPATSTAASNKASQLNLPDGYRAEIIATDLRGPTQMLFGPDGRLWVTQLNGGENNGDGQVVALDLSSGTQEILLDGLLKPTGLAVLDGYLWVSLENSLVRGKLDTQNNVGELAVVLDEMPYNGRSNGTLTISPSNTLIYETSGRRQGNQPSAGSGSLWELDPATLESKLLATGLKGAYAHTFDSNGRLWTTEIGDGTFNGGPPPDELNLVVEGADFGWPQCIGLQEPALNYDGTEERCAQSRPPVAILPNNSTPTSIVVSPFAPDTLLVTLWVAGEVVEVPVTFAGDNAQGEARPFITQMGNPQSLLLTEDGAVLVSDFSNGTVYRVYRP